MTKTLLKKQFKELYAAYFRSGNSKKKNSKALPVVYALLMLYVAGFLFFCKFFSFLDGLLGCFDFALLRLVENNLFIA